ncbi:MAG TPA: M14 family zinc carboxypeptidase [Feifaniaceae bacterium]|nr:M14 family zinc carboxypeptidase [Feifaniaceae bacterium]
MTILYLLLYGLFGETARTPGPYSYEFMQRDLAALRKKYPGTLQVEVVGRSRQNRAIYAARAGDPGAERHVLIQAGMHGREYMTTLLAMRQLQRLLERGVPEGTLVHILPMTNPDGVTISQKGEATPWLTAVYERDLYFNYTDLPLGQYLRCWKANAAGVDINRNFDAQWDRIDTVDAPSYAYYRGTAPESEPETRALAEYAQKYPFGATISYHATGSEIFYDFGGNEAVNKAGYRLARAVAIETGYGVTPDDGTSFGGFKDWAIETLSIPSLTIEVGKRRTPLPGYEFFSIWDKNKDVPYVVSDFIKQNR